MARDILRYLPFSGYLKIPDIQTARTHPLLVIQILRDLRSHRREVISVNRYTMMGLAGHRVINRSLAEIGLRITAGKYDCSNPIVEFFGLDSAMPNWRKIHDIEVQKIARRGSVEVASRLRRGCDEVASRLDQVAPTDTAGSDEVASRLRRGSVEVASRLRRGNSINRPVTNNQTPTARATAADPIPSKITGETPLIAAIRDEISGVWTLARGQRWNDAMVQQVYQACLSGDDPVCDAESNDLVAAAASKASSVDDHQYLPSLTRWISTGEWRTCIPGPAEGRNKVLDIANQMVVDLIGAATEGGIDMLLDPSILQPDNARYLQRELVLTYRESVQDQSPQQRMYDIAVLLDLYPAIVSAAADSINAEAVRCG